MGCEAISGSIGWFYDAIFNNSTTTGLEIQCPLITDGGGGNNFSTWVTLWDGSSSSDISCTVVGLNFLSYYQTPVAQFASGNTTGISSQWQGVGIGTVQTHASQYLYCYLPPKQSGGLAHGFSSYKIIQ
jgi:hypothetical protein